MNATAILKNKRVFFLGVNTGFVQDGLPDNQFIDFYRERSSAHLYCAILGNIVIPGGFGTNNQTPTLSTHSRWAAIAEAISSEGTAPGIQLATTWPSYIGQRKFVVREPSETIKAARQLLSMMTRDDIDSVMDGFRAAAQMAVTHGYQHIQIHAAHGYLPCLLLDKDLNPLAPYVKDEMAELASFLRSQKVETSVRWSIRTGDSEFDQRGIEESVSNVSSLQFDFVDLSSGHYNIDKRLIYPSTDYFLSQRHHDSLEIANKFPEQRFILSGRVSAFLGDLPNNVEVGLCRDLIANPRFLTELTDGCRNRGKCHYHSRGLDRLSCPTWSESSRREA
ncbi:hypothetical protein ACOQFT_03510 [Ruegeria sp. MALMAid1280]